PIVASGVHGIPEMVRDGREAILVPPGDTAALADGLRRMLGSPDEAARLGAAARVRVEAEFGIETVMPRHLALASGLAGRRAGPQFRPLAVNENDAYIFHVETPEKWTFPGGKIWVSGWFVSKIGAVFRDMRLFIDDRPYTGIFGVSRPEIEQKYRGYAGLP